ncbi:hypothetical protein IJ732_04390 [bacterium]|nr:hypothetical protein [bacterium]
MSFNINFNKPAITNAQAAQDGGAGNLGYMQGGGQGKNKHQEQANSIFEEQRDSFVKEGQEKESFETYLERILLTAKLIVLKILSIFKLR